jgi:glycine/D-amino acid oxidase-like deaminating enzyme
LAERGCRVSIIERRTALLQATSAATHNRAHLGYHYPRCPDTAQECQQGLAYFRARYPQALYYPHANYYLIERGSLTDPEQYRSFCEAQRLPYVLSWPEGQWLNRRQVAASFQVHEPCFALEVLRQTLTAECAARGVTVLTGTKVLGVEPHGSTHRVTVARGRERRQLKADVVINATYAHSNHILRAASLRDEATEYEFHTTEVVVARLPGGAAPALTVMDGPFASVMPMAGTTDLYLIYDVVHSVQQRRVGWLYRSPRDVTSHWRQMVEHGAQYFPFMRSLEYVQSLWGARPIPCGDRRGSRATRVVEHTAAPGFFSILEGKFISAPLIAGRLVDKLLCRGLVA